MSGKLRIIILTVLSVTVIGILVYIMISTGAANNTLLRAFVILIGLVASIVKISARVSPTRILRQYEKIYTKTIGDAFSNNKSNRKHLLEIARCFAEDKLEKGLSEANKLWNKCETVGDKKAVGTFKALILTDLGDKEEAKVIYEYLVNDLGIQDDTIYSNLGLIYSESGDYDNAVKYYTLANKINPNNAYAWTNAAFVLIRLFEIDKAIECAENAIRIDYKMYNAYEILAAAYTYKGDTKLAKKYYHTAIVNGANKSALKEFISRFNHDTEFSDDDDIE